MNSTELRRAVLILASLALACVALLGQQLPSGEIDRWNKIYKDEPDRIRWEPNEFLVSVAAKLKPSDAFDAAIGQGVETASTWPAKDIERS